MPVLVVHRDASGDLDDLWEADEERAQDIEILLEEISGSETFLNALHVHQRTEGRFHVSRLLEFSVWGKFLYRLRVSELTNLEQLNPYRIIYACSGEWIHVVAIMHRDREYEKDVHLTQRIQQACRELGVPTGA